MLKVLKRVSIISGLLVFLALSMAFGFGSSTQEVQAKEVASDCKYSQVNLIILNDFRWKDLNRLTTPNIYEVLSEYSTASLSPGRTPESKDSSRFFTTLSSGTRTLDDTFDDYSRIYEKNIKSEFNADTTNFAVSATDAGKTISLFSDKPIIGDEKALIIDKDQNPLGKELPVEKIEEKNLSDINIVSLASGKSMDNRFSDAYEKLPTKNALNIVVGSINYTSRHLSVAAIDFGEGKELFSRTRLRKGLVEVQDIAPTVFDSMCIKAASKVEGGVISAKNTDSSFSARSNEYSQDNTNSKIRGSKNKFATFLVLFSSILITVLVMLKKTLKQNISFSKGFYRLIISFAFGIFVSCYLTNVIQSLTVDEWELKLLLFLFVIGVFVSFISWILFKPAFILVMLTADLFLDNVLQVNSAFGYSFISNSRSYGFSNYSGAAVGICGLVIFFHLYAKRKSFGNLFAVLLTLIVALPNLGADVGGTFAVVAAFATFYVAVNNDKLDLKKLIKVGVISSVAVLFFGFIDYLRPVEERSHLGRTFDSIVHLEFIDFFSIIYRKMIGALGTVNSPWFVIMLICILGITLIIKKFQLSVDRSQIYAVIIYCFIGTVLNDAGTIFGAVSLFLYMLFLLEKAASQLPAKVNIE
jgi:hypothetical protein